MPTDLERFWSKVDMTDDATLIARLCECWRDHAMNDGMLGQVLTDAINRIESLSRELEQARGALADIAFSDDMTLVVARAKAKRIYDALVAQESANTEA